MPIYEYQCQKCGHKLEAIQKMTEAALTDCPVCHTPSLQKLVSAAGFQLKGTGWYVTDFRDKGKKDTAKSKETTTNSGESSSSGETKKTDSGSSSTDTAATKS
jgi:putative FmdB family regulatory protein